MNPSQHPTSGQRLISSAEFKARLGGISEVSRWRREKAGIGPQPIKLHRRNFYIEHEVDSYLAALGASRHDQGDTESDGAPGLCEADAAAERLATIDTNEGASGD